VAAWSLYLPGVDLAAALPELVSARPELLAEPVYPADRAAELLGRKGLLNKNPATRLALCAIHRALGLPARAPRPDGPPDPRVAVVASSNTGNVASVVEVVRAVRTGGRKAVSPLTVANASSNVMASAVAIWFRYGGPNVMLCSGATSGLDALAVASLLVRSGRTDRAVVVGAEPAGEAVAALDGTGGTPASAGAACVVLAAADAAPSAPLLGPVRPAARPAAGPPSPAADLVTRCGDLYGALGVAQAAVAAAMVGAGGPVVSFSCGDAIDGWRTVDVLPP
jgi:hypothetical protein